VYTKITHLHKTEHITYKKA